MYITHENSVHFCQWEKGGALCKNDNCAMENANEIHLRQSKQFIVILTLAITNPFQTKSDLLPYKAAISLNDFRHFCLIFFKLTINTFSLFRYVIRCNFNRSLKYIKHLSLCCHLDLFVSIFCVNRHTHNESEDGKK